MASYKVPQDVEAEDKLIGPFSFRQFAYLVISVIASGLCYFLGRIFVPLLLIPLPVAILFLALSLPLKKDQPMEIYLGAILSFYFRPRLKIWQQDGIENIVEITNEIVDEDLVNLRGLTNEQAQERLAFLSQVVDTEGWAIRGVNNNTRFQDNIIAEAKQTEDIHEDNSEVIKAFDQMISSSDNNRRAAIIHRLNSKETVINPIQNNNSIVQPPPQSDFQIPIDQPIQTTTVPNQQPQTYSGFEPINSPIINPNISEPIQMPNPEPEPEPEINKADIINLATNKDLSIKAIAAEANRIKERNRRLLGGQDEVVISLR